MAEEKQEEKSVETDFKKLRKQAKVGVLKAQYLLAVKLASGDGVEADAKEAEKWYRKAAKRDFPPAMNNLALLHAGEALGASNPKQAVKWYRKAAELGYASAQWNLARHLRSGEGVTPDEEEAID